MRIQGGEMGGGLPLRDLSKISLPNIGNMPFFDAML